MAQIKSWVRASGKRGWFARVFLGAGGDGKLHYVRRNFDTERDAKVWANKMESKRADGGLVPTTKLRTGEYLDRWLENVKGNLSPTVFPSYKGIVERDLKPNFGYVPLKKLSAPMIQAWLTKQREANTISGTTMLYHYRILHAALAAAVEEGTLGINPCDRVPKKQRPKKDRPNLPQWDHEELRLFLAEAKRSSAYYPIYLTAILTGMRRGELLGLRWQDVDFLMNTATISQSHYEVSGKVSFKAPKTDNSRRTLDLPETVMEEFRRIRTEQEKARDLLGDVYAKDLDLIFCQHSGKPLYGDNIAKDFHRVIRRAKVRCIRFHDLRHLHVGLLIDEGANSRLISERLGHSSVGFTLQQYGFLMKGAQREAVQKLEARILGASAPSAQCGTKLERDREAS